MNNLFSFDVTLKELMNLGERAQDVPKLEIILNFLRMFWYDLEDSLSDQEIERWNNIRVGSINVYFNEHKQLCMEFATRFTFENNPQIIKFLEGLKDV